MARVIQPINLCRERPAGPIKMGRQLATVLTVEGMQAAGRLVTLLVVEDIPAAVQPATLRAEAEIRAADRLATPHLVAVADTPAAVAVAGMQAAAGSGRKSTRLNSSH